MPQKCSICFHENQLDIDRLLLAETPLRKVAERFGTSITALHRHKQHISKILIRGKEIAEITRADTLLDQVKGLLRKAERLTELAEQVGSLDTALRGIAQVRSVLQLLGEVSGQLAGKGTQIAIGINAGAAAAPNFRTMSDDELRAALHRYGAHNPPLLEGEAL